MTSREMVTPSVSGDAANPPRGARPVGSSRSTGRTNPRRRKRADVVRLTLPMPPSVNALWKRGRTGMYRSPSYMTWLTAAGYELEAQRPGSIAGNFVISVRFERARRRGSDLDNRLKGLLDLLEAHGVIQNDALADGIVAMWSPAVKGCAVVLRPVAVREERAAA